MKSMRHSIEIDFVEICRRIVAEGKDIHEWNLIEADDMFELGNYAGGFDADEEAFCFSVFLDTGEHWFQISLNDVKLIAAGRIREVEIRPAE
jgi:hypothetical protein